MSTSKISLIGFTSSATFMIKMGTESPVCRCVGGRGGRGGGGGGLYLLLHRYHENDYCIIMGGDVSQKLVLFH